MTKLGAVRPVLRCGCNAMGVMLSPVMFTSKLKETDRMGILCMTH